MNRKVVISGCSGGGKSTLLAELKRRGFSVVEEPGRRVVRSELHTGGTALPWKDLHAFLNRVISVALDDLEIVEASEKWVFLDRGVIDAVIGLHHLTGHPISGTLNLSDYYHKQVFMVPPWPEIYVQDNERRHNLDSATEEYMRLLSAYPKFDYNVSIVPKVGVSQRADFLLNALTS